MAAVSWHITAGSSDGAGAFLCAPTISTVACAARQSTAAVAVGTVAPSDAQPEKAESGLADPVASVAHTARAVRALAQVQAARSAAQASLEAEVCEAVEQAAAWLAGPQDLGQVSEIIDRQLADRVEQVYVRHFTAAWVVKALVSVGLPASHPSVSTAVARIWADYSHDDALWSWSNGDLPVWMTLDAVDALHLAALAATIRPVGLGVP